MPTTNLANTNLVSNLSGSYYNWSPIYGGQPSVPDPTSTASASISGNTANLASLYGLVQPLTQQQNTLALANLNQNLPGYSAAQSTNMGNIQDELSGNIPGDVLYNLGEAAAERGISTGSPGSPNSSAAYLRALGLTSLDLTKMGQSGLGASVAMTPTVAPINPMSWLSTADQQQAAQYAANVTGSSPIPAYYGQNAMQQFQSGKNYGQQQSQTPVDPFAEADATEAAWLAGFGKGGATSPALAPGGTSPQGTYDLQMQGQSPVSGTAADYWGGTDFSNYDFSPLFDDNSSYWGDTSGGDLSNYDFSDLFS